MLQEGMIITNEPGFYKEGEFGIRIENINLVEKHNDDFLKFKSLTLVPYCSKLIDRSLLDKSHENTIKQYYSKIEKDILPLVNARNKEHEVEYIHEELDAFKWVSSYSSKYYSN